MKDHFRKVAVHGQFSSDSSFASYIRTLVCQKRSFEAAELSDLNRLSEIGNQLLIQFAEELKRYIAEAGKNTGAANKRRTRAYQAIKQIQSDFSLVRSAIKNAITSTMRTRRTIQNEIGDEFVTMYRRDRSVELNYTFKIRIKLTGDAETGRTKEYKAVFFHPIKTPGAYKPGTYVSKAYQNATDTIANKLNADLKLLFEMYELICSDTTVLNELLSTWRWTNYEALNELPETTEANVEQLLKKWKSHLKRTYSSSVTYHNRFDSEE